MHETEGRRGAPAEVGVDWEAAAEAIRDAELAQEVGEAGGSTVVLPGVVRPSRVELRFEPVSIGYAGDPLRTVRDQAIRDAELERRLALEEPETEGRGAVIAIAAALAVLFFCAVGVLARF